MSKRACITFDFDGTLYPIAPYDSEQRLIRKVASTKGTLFRQRAKRLILQDQKGTLIGDAFHKRYAHLVRTANAV
jgi:phosphoserine phosphatase